MSEGKWEAFGRLEQAVTEASERLRALRAENEQLRVRVADLEAERQQEMAERSAHQDSWQSERRELSERVERLAAGLEGLLAGVE